MSITLSKNFATKEFFHSLTAISKGIDNSTTDATILGNLRHLAVNLLQPLRDKVSTPIIISSGFRTKQLNLIIPNSSTTSQHTKGQASDIMINGYTPYEIGKTVRSLGLKFDQMILYPTFVHLSYNASGNRNQLLYNKSYKGKKL